jgi:2-keto-3-deoxy-L-rhamnonate aldolase RhmA
MLHKKPYKVRMREKAQIGIRSQLASPIVAELLGSTGFDFIYIDMEHAPNELLAVIQQCQALAGTPAEPVVRVPENSHSIIARMLDAGVENLVVPMVESREEAEHAAAATRFPPKGKRGFGGVHRGSRFGLDANYVASLDDRVCLTVQVESRKGLANLKEIAATDGVDCVLFGPADLAADMGYLGQQEHKDVVAAIEAGVATVVGAGKFAGMSTGSPESGRKWVEKGCRSVSIAGDMAILAREARRLATS